MSGMSPWAMLGSARRDRSVVEQKMSRDTVRRSRRFRAAPPRADRELPVLRGHRRRARRRQPAADQAPPRRRHPRQGHQPRHLAGARHGAGLDPRRRARRGHRLPLLAHRREPDLRPAHQGVRPRAADVAGVLHPHPDRRARLPAQQRRDRRAARVHLDPVGHRLQLDQRGRRRHHHVRAELAGHPGLPRALPAAAARLALGRSPDQRPHPSPDGRQRRPRQPDDRAVQRRRRPAAQALRPPRRGGREVRREGRARPRPRHPHLPGHPGVHGDDDADPGAGHRPRLRHRRHASRSAGR